MNRKEALEAMLAGNKVKNTYNADKSLYLYWNEDKQKVMLSNGNDPYYFYSIDDVYRLTGYELYVEYDLTFKDAMLLMLDCNYVEDNVQKLTFRYNLDKQLLLSTISKSTPCSWNPIYLQKLKFIDTIPIEDRMFRQVPIF